MSATAPSGPRAAEPHLQRKELARFLLDRGGDALAGPAEEGGQTRAALAVERAVRGPIAFPEGLAPSPVDGSHPSPGERLPSADVVVITWTVDELAGLACVLTPGVNPSRWAPYDRHFDSVYRPQLRRGAPALMRERLASYQAVKIGPHTVLCMKSELHLNQDGKPTGVGTATLPVKDFFAQVIEETGARLVLTVGTAGSVFDEFGLGDVVVTRGAKFRLTQEFRNEPFNDHTYTSDWELPTSQLPAAEALIADFTHELALPPVGAPAPGYPLDAELLAPDPPRARIRLDGRDMPPFHPILTTDYFEYGTTANRLDHEGSGVEMGDAALGLACSQLTDPPRWAVVRNMSDPVINGRLPAKEFHLNLQTTWAVGFYTAYGLWTSVIGALATWGLIAGLHD
jgi:hypothetical protein